MLLQFFKIVTDYLICKREFFTGNLLQNVIRLTARYPEIGGIKSNLIFKKKSGSMRKGYMILTFTSVLC